MPRQQCSQLESKPANTIQCFGPPCRPLWPLEPGVPVHPMRDHRETEPCQDVSKFCGLLRGKWVSMCQAERLKETCCSTCTNLQGELHKTPTQN